jgi:hypothetical protein
MFDFAFPNVLDIALLDAGSARSLACAPTLSNAQPI